MDAPFPCSNPPSTCETNPNPATTFSSEAEDSTTFIAIAWNNTPPALGTPFTSTPCEAIAESQVSQAEADRLATNQAVNCSNPCATPVYNSAQSASGLCSDGNPYSFTVPAGVFSAENQVLADRKAFAAATAALRGHSICLGSLAPVSVCINEFYFGIISLVTTDAPATIALAQGDLPEGLTMSIESDRVVIQGTPSSFGTALFALTAVSTAGVVTSKNYSVSVTGIVTGSVLTDGDIGVPYSVQLQAVTQSAPVWSVVSGSLPDGLSLDANTGIISGDPTTNGDSSFTIGATADGQTCTKDFSLHVAGSVGPACIVFQNDFSTPGSPDPNVTGTHSAADRRIVVSRSNDGLLTFIDTSTNTVLASTAWNGTNFGLEGELGCYATSVQRFFFPSFNGVDVYDRDGNFITSVAMPGTMFAGSQRNLVYSPEQDLVYGISRDSSGPTRMFFSVDPNTNTSTQLGSIGSTSNYRLLYTPNRIVIKADSFRMQTWLLPAMTLENTLNLGSITNGEMAYAPNTGKVFVPINTFATPVSFVQVDLLTLTVDMTITTSAANGLLGFWQYNPVTGLVIAMDDQQDVVVFDPVTESIVCEFAAPQSPGFVFVSGLAEDYSSGQVYLLSANNVDNPMNVYQ